MKEMNGRPSTRLEDKGRVEGGKWSPRGEKRHLKASSGYSSCCPLVICPTFPGFPSWFSQRSSRVHTAPQPQEFLRLLLYWRPGWPGALDPPPKLRSQACAVTGSP